LATSADFAELRLFPIEAGKLETLPSFLVYAALKVEHAILEAV